MKTTKKPKGLEPCRGFKSFRLFNSVSLFLENPVFAGSDPCGRKKSQNGSVFFRKKAGTKKREKSLEISRFLLFSRADRFWPHNMAGAQGLEPWAYGFGDRRSTNWAIPLYSLRDAFENWWAFGDSNPGPSGYEPDALTNWAKGPYPHLSPSLGYYIRMARKMQAFFSISKKFSFDVKTAPLA